MAAMQRSSILLLAVALLGVFAAQAAAETSGRGRGRAPKCKSRYTQYPCPECNPNSQCLKTECIGPAEPGFATVVLKAKKCFGRTPITYIAVAYGKKNGPPVCADNRIYSSKSYSRSGYSNPNSDKFKFKAKCGSTVKLYLQDSKLYNEDGGVYVRNDPCSSKCDKTKPCNTCGPYKVVIKCKNMCMFNTPPPGTPASSATPPPGVAPTPVRIAVPPPKASSATPPPGVAPTPVRVGVPPPKASSATPPPGVAPTPVRVGVPPPKASSATPPPGVAPTPVRVGVPPPKASSATPPPGVAPTPVRVGVPPPKASSATPPPGVAPTPVRVAVPPPKASSATPPPGVAPPPPFTCPPKKPKQTGCPKCIPTQARGCYKVQKCAEFKAGYAKVTLNPEKCFDKPVSFAAFGYEGQTGKAACGVSKPGKGKGKRNQKRDVASIVVKCGTVVDLYLQDNSFYNKDGQLALPFNNPCKKQCGGFAPCTLCGGKTYRFKITCKCKKTCGKNCWKD